LFNHVNVLGNSCMFIYYCILFLLHIIIFVYISVLVIYCQYSCFCRFLFAYNFSVNIFMQVIHNVFKKIIERDILHLVLAHFIFLRAKSRLNYLINYCTLCELYFIVCNVYLLCLDSLLPLTLWLMCQTYM
jgi:hypothetical protein